MEPLGIGLSALSPLINYGINALSHGQQLRHQEDFQKQQIKGNKEMQDYSQKLALDTWDKTNYDAQRKQMEKAGLNPGLMYGMGGSGGATTNSGSAPSVSSGTAVNSSQNGMGLQMASQIALMKAQKENIEADTANKKADIPVKGAQVPNIESGTNKNIADTKLTEQNTAIATFNTEIARINSELAVEGKSLNVGMLNEKYNNLLANTELTEAQRDEARAKIVNLAVDNSLKRSTISRNTQEVEESKARIENIITSQAQTWYHLNTEAQTAGLKQLEQALHKEGMNSNDISQLITLAVGLYAGGKGKGGNTQGGLKYNTQSGYKY